MEHGEPPSEVPRRGPFFSGPSAASSDPNIRIGQQLGRYTLLRVLGEGGYGVVYLAEQARPVRRHVALKIIKPGMDTRQVLARFEGEQQALALLEHPYIARVFDAGSDPTGHPYFVMEYVKGVAITDFCDVGALGIPERLDLFLKVCQAVQHAHQKGIIHRDLKPSNILVAAEDLSVVPKIIDFGIARAVGPSLTDRSLYTEPGQWVGTPEYMSPEQAASTHRDIDIRTDIYALGVILYEVLSGTLPFDPDTLRESGPEQARRIICEHDPRRPSTRIGRLPEGTVTTVCRARGTDPRSLASALRGDLDWIVLKAMEKDRQRRYQNVTEIVEDIRRHRNSEPILAAGPSVVYRARKFVRRHRTGLTWWTTALFVVLGVTFGVVMYLQATRQHAYAERLRHRDMLDQARDLFFSKRYDLAKEQLTPLISSPFVHREAQLLKITIEMSTQSSPEDAIPLLQSLTHLEDAVAGQAHFLLSRLYYESFKAEASVQFEKRRTFEYHQKRAAELMPDTAETHLLQAMAAEGYTQRMAHLETALDREPVHYGALAERGFLQYLSGDYEKALWEGTRMTGVRPYDALGYTLSAMALRKMRRWPQAVEFLDQAIQQEPQDSFLYDLRSQTLVHLEDYQAALEDVQHCVQLWEDGQNSFEDTYYRFQTLAILTNMGRYEDALGQYTEMRQRDPGRLDWYYDRFAEAHVLKAHRDGRSWHGAGPAPQGLPFGIMNWMETACQELNRVAGRLEVEDLGPWSPDGTRLLVRRGLEATCALLSLNLETGQERLLALPGGVADWSPDGRWVAYDRSPSYLSAATLSRVIHETLPAGTEVWLVAADGSADPRRLTAGSEPVWGDRGDEVFYVGPERNTLFSLSPFDPQADPEPIISAGRCCVSPDGRYVAQVLEFSLHVFDLSTGLCVAQWSQPPGTWIWNVTWCPGGRLLIGGGSGCQLGLWVTDLKSAELRRILLGPIGAPFLSKQGRLAFLVGGKPYWEGWMIENLEEADLPRVSVREHCLELADYYGRQTRFDPQNPTNYLDRALCLLYAGDEEEGFADVDAYRVLVEDQQEVLAGLDWLALRLALVPHDDCRPELVLGLAEKMVDLAPDDQRSAKLRGLAHYRAGRWQEALEVLEQATELGSHEMSQSLLLQAMAHQRLGQAKEARACYEEAMQHRAYENWTAKSTYDALLFETRALLQISMLEQ